MTRRLPRGSRTLLTIGSSLALIAGLGVSAPAVAMADPDEDTPDLFSLLSAVPLNAQGEPTADLGLRAVAGRDTALAVDVTPDPQVIAGMAIDTSFTVDLPTGLRYIRVVNDLDSGVSGSWSCAQSDATVSCQFTNGAIPSGQLARALLILRGDSSLPTSGRLDDVRVEASTTIVLPDETTVPLTHAEDYPVFAAREVPTLIAVRDRARPQPVANRNVLSLGATVIGPLPAGAPPVRVQRVIPREGTRTTLRGTGFTCTPATGSCVGNGSWGLGSVHSITGWFALPASVEFTRWQITSRYASRAGVTVVDRMPMVQTRNVIPGPAFAVQWETGSGQGVMPGEMLPVRTLVTNTVMAEHTPTLRVTAPQGLRLVPSASNWSCARSGATVTCTRRAPMGPEEADLVVWRVRADASAQSGTVDLRAEVGPGPRNVERTPITIGSFGDPIVGLTIDDRVGNRWRAWEDGSTREIAVDQVSPYRVTVTNVGGGVLRRGQRVAITQTIGSGIADVVVDTPRAACTVTEDLLRCEIRATRDVAPGELIGRLRVGVIPDTVAPRVDLGPLRSRVVGSRSDFTEVPIRFAAIEPRLPVYVSVENVTPFTVGGGGEMNLRVVNEDSAPIFGLRLVGTLPPGIRLSEAVVSRAWTCDEKITGSTREVVCTLNRTLTEAQPQAVLRMPLLVSDTATPGPATIVWRADAVIPEQRTQTTSVTFGISAAGELDASAHPAVVPVGLGDAVPVTLRSGLSAPSDRAWTFTWRQMCTKPVDTWPQICDGASSRSVPVAQTATGATTALIPSTPATATGYVFEVKATDGSAIIYDYVRVTTTAGAPRGDITPATFAPGIDCAASATTCTGQAQIPAWLTSVASTSVSTTPATFSQNPAQGSFSASVSIPGPITVAMEGASVTLDSLTWDIDAQSRVTQTASGSGTLVGANGSQTQVTVSIAPTESGDTGVGIARVDGTWSSAFGMAGLVAQDVAITFASSAATSGLTTAVSGIGELPAALRTEFSMPAAPALISGTTQRTTLAVDSQGSVLAGDLGPVGAATIEIAISGAAFELSMDARFLQQRMRISAPLQLQPVRWQAREDLGLIQFGNTLFADGRFDAVVSQGTNPQIDLSGTTEVFGSDQRMSGPMFLDEGGTPVAVLSMTNASMNVGDFELRDVTVEITIVDGPDSAFSFGTGSATTTALGQEVTFDGLQFIFADNLINRIFDVTDASITVGDGISVSGDLRLNYLAQTDEFTIGGDMNVQAGEFEFTDASVVMQPTCAEISTRYRADGAFSVNARLQGVVSSGGQCTLPSPEALTPASVSGPLEASLICLSASVPRIGIGDARGPGDVVITNARDFANPGGAVSTSQNCLSLLGGNDRGGIDADVRGIAYASLQLGAQNVDNSVGVITQFGPGEEVAGAIGVANYTADDLLVTQSIPGGVLRIAGFTLAQVNVTGTNQDGSLNLNGVLSFFGNTITFSGSYREVDGIPETSLRAGQQQVRMLGFVAQGRDFSLSQSRNGGSLSFGAGFNVRGLGGWEKRFTLVVNGSDIRFWASGQTSVNVIGISFGVTLIATNCTDSSCTAGTNPQLRGRGYFSFSGISFDTGNFVIDPVTLFRINTSGSGSFNVSTGFLSARAWGSYSAQLVISPDEFRASGSVSGGASARLGFIRASINIGVGLSFNPLGFCVRVIRDVCFSF